MNQAVPQAVAQQHPAVVLRSNYNHLRTLLAVAMVAVVGLTVAVVILATNDATSTNPFVRPAATSVPAVAAPNGGTRYDGGPEEGTRGIVQSAPAPTTAPGTRYDGGPEEGTRGLAAATDSPSGRYVGGSKGRQADSPASADSSGIAAQRPGPAGP